MSISSEIEGPSTTLKIPGIVIETLNMKMLLSEGKNALDQLIVCSLNLIILYLKESLNLYKQSNELLLLSLW